eukprot:CAMPEP_0168517650 /NCGR_PEP_ID=MMETSP0405-20121227/6183_1 /TAXON_ID=498012 /ORGANISM="Trichosphaerium sp, Strain Am-I-7 wt" /LENGTH=270 /DNA_ID=CAMNT_0008537711 /DNA_START=360 /DNA_END=1172 /DNA_ORIENTATION=-
MIPDNTEFFITIEEQGTMPTTPSTSKVVSGVFSEQKTILSADSIWGADPFADLAGTFFLATPTSGNDTTDECNGIWFFNATGPSASLNLPTPPTGWQYEGWVVDISDPQNPMPMSTGTFTDPAGPDSDGAGPYAGPDSAPMYPGQDYVMTVTKDLCEDYMAVITIEPNPDRNPDTPFFLKPLSAAIMNITGPGNYQMLTAVTNVLPRIEVSVEESSPTAAGPVTSGPSEPTPDPTVAPTEAPSGGSGSGSGSVTIIASIALLFFSAFFLL